jgi:hypothetical protein
MPGPPQLLLFLAYPADLLILCLLPSIVKDGALLIFRVAENTNQRIMSRVTGDVYGRNKSSHKGRYRYRRRGVLE